MVLAAVTACSGSSGPTATHGPISSIVHVGPTGVQLYAVHHRLELAELPLPPSFPLPVTGAIEVGAGVTIPLDGLQPDLPHARGRAALRCVGHCQLGDDHTPLSLGDPGSGMDVSFGHLDLDGLEAHVEIGQGRLRLTRWSLHSADVDLAVALEVDLALDPGASELDGCVRFRPTAALATRDPRLSGLLALAAPAGDDGWHAFRVTGPVRSPRLRPDDCQVTTAP